MFYYILHRPARIILKVHKLDCIIPFLRTLQWLSFRTKSKVLVKPFTAMRLLPATPNTHQPRRPPFCCLNSPNICPPQAFELAVPLCGRLISSNLQASSFLLFRPQCRCQIFREALLLTLSALVTPPWYQFYCFRSTYCSLKFICLLVHLFVVYLSPQTPERKFHKSGVWFVLSNLIFLRPTIVSTWYISRMQ